MKKAFDYIVIGGGSGGMASARRAAQYGAKVRVENVGDTQLLPHEGVACGGKSSWRDLR
jgi:pyruvate/2-oxoglutarate dehydrogenase complex dihydrolipoamide dehydrogenase (E3) component